MIYFQIMVLTAINFSFITLNMYSSSKMLIQGSSFILTTVNLLGWVIFYCSFSYGNIHMGHFSKHEVKLKKKFKFIHSFKSRIVFLGIENSRNNT